MRTPVAFTFILFLFIACNNSTEEKVTDPSRQRTNDSTIVSAPSGSLSNNELINTYSLAIAEFITAAQQNNKSAFDTLFFGKLYDFPDIVLPKVIKGVKISLLTTEEVTAHRSLYKRSSPYINLVGWIDTAKAEFIFVTFFPSFQHQYDGFINFKYAVKQKGFELDTIKFENYLYNKKGDLERIMIYKNGKHSGDKPIPKN